MSKAFNELFYNFPVHYYNDEDDYVMRLMKKFILKKLSHEIAGSHITAILIILYNKIG